MNFAQMLIRIRNWCLWESFTFGTQCVVCMGRGPGKKRFLKLQLSMGSREITMRLLLMTSFACGSMEQITKCSAHIWRFRYRKSCRLTRSKNMFIVSTPGKTTVERYQKKKSFADFPSEELTFSSKRFRVDSRHPKWNEALLYSFCCLL